MRKHVLFIVLGIGLLTGLIFSMPAQAETASSEICVGGAVANPMCLKFEDLALMEPAVVRQGEVTTDKKFHGTFVFKGVPLKTLLTLARIKKDKDAPFNKEVDLAVVLRSKSGQQVVPRLGGDFLPQSIPCDPRLRGNPRYSSPSTRGATRADLCFPQAGHGGRISSPTA